MKFISNQSILKLVFDELRFIMKNNKTRVLSITENKTETNQTKQILTTKNSGKSDSYHAQKIHT